MTIPAASSRDVGAIVEVDGVTGMSLVNQISKMEAWASFTFN